MHGTGRQVGRQIAGEGQILKASYKSKYCGTVDYEHIGTT